MFLFLPIGHERELRRRPWVTAVIVALCLLIHVRQELKAPDEEWLFTEMMACVQEMMSTPGVDHTAAQRFLDSIDADPAAAFQRLADGEVPGVTHETKRRALGVVEKIGRWKSQDLRYAWADRHDSPAINLLLSLFVHAGWLHLIGNMLFLWVCGPAVEDRWGHGVFAAFYFAGGIVATFTFRILFKGDQWALIGASGAISGAMGAFLVCFTHVKLRVWYFFWAFYLVRTGVFAVAAWVPLGLWFGEQLLSTMFDDGSFVAYSAHVGGFLAGVGVAYALRRSGVEKRHLLTKEYVQEEEDLEAERVTSPDDEDLETALGYARSGQRTAAIGLLKAILRRNPKHHVARRELVFYSLDEDKEEARRHCSDVLVEIVKSGPAEVLAFYRNLEKHGVHAALAPRALAEVVRAASASGEAALAVGLTKHLLTTAPHLPVMPRLLWDVAMLQEGQGRQDLADRTLQVLLQKYGGDVIADQARQRLAQRWSA